MSRKKTTSLTAYYNRDPQELICEIPEIHYGGQVAWLLNGLGFKQVKNAHGAIPGKFQLFEKSENRLDRISHLTKIALDCDVDYSFQI